MKKEKKLSIRPIVIIFRPVSSWGSLAYVFLDRVDEEQHGEDVPAPQRTPVLSDLLPA